MVCAGITLRGAHWTMWVEPGSLILFGNCTVWRSGVGSEMEHGGIGAAQNQQLSADFAVH